MPELATNLLLIARSPASGRLRHRGALEMGLRAALFAELIFDNRIVNDAGAPAVTDQEPLADRVLDTLRNAVRDHPRVAWRRWYHHAAADRVVLTKGLVESERWVAERDRIGRVRLLDTQQDATIAFAEQLSRVVDRQRQPADGHEAVLTILVTLCAPITGRPRPRQLRRSLRPLLDAVGPVSDPERRAIQAALGGAALAIGRRARILG